MGCSLSDPPPSSSHLRANRRLNILHSFTKRLELIQLIVGAEAAERYEILLRGMWSRKPLKQLPCCFWISADGYRKRERQLGIIPRLGGAKELPQRNGDPQSDGLNGGCISPEGFHQHGWRIHTQEDALRPILSIPNSSWNQRLKRKEQSCRWRQLFIVGTVHHKQTRTVCSG